MGLYRQVGGRWVRDHGSVQTGGGDGQETTGLYRQVGGMGKRPWVCTNRWGDGQETMGLYRQVGGGWVRDHGFIQTSRVGGWEGDHRSMQTSHHE